MADPRTRSGRPFKPSTIDVDRRCWDGEGHRTEPSHRYGLVGRRCTAGCDLFWSLGELERREIVR